MSKLRHLFWPRVESSPRIEPREHACAHPQTGLVVLTAPSERLVTARDWPRRPHRHIDVDAESAEFEDALEHALATGCPVIDVEAEEAITPLSLDERGHALLREAVAEVSAGGYLVVEGGPELTYYVQLLVEGDEASLEAVAGRHLFGLRPKVERLRLLGFRASSEGPNLVRHFHAAALAEEPHALTHLIAGALESGYGLAEAPLRMRLRLAQLAR